MKLNCQIDVYRERKSFFFFWLFLKENCFLTLRLFGITYLGIFEILKAKIFGLLIQKSNILEFIQNILKFTQNVS